MLGRFRQTFSIIDPAVALDDVRTPDHDHVTATSINRCHTAGGDEHYGIGNDDNDRGDRQAV
jgi:hypothetical protein